MKRRAILPGNAHNSDFFPQGEPNYLSKFQKCQTDYGVCSFFFLITSHAQELFWDNEQS